MTATTLAATIAATAAAIAAAATATATARSLQRVIELLQLRLLCGTSLDNAADKLQVATGKRMIEVHNHLERSNLLHGSQDGRAVGAHHLNDIAFVDVCRVELAVNGEHLAVEILNVVGVILAVCLGRGYYKVESITFFQILKISLKSIERKVESADEAERLFACCFLHILGNAVTMRDKLVSYAEKLMLCFHNLLIFDNRLKFRVYNFL